MAEKQVEIRSDGWIQGDGWQSGPDDAAMPCPFCGDTPIRMDFRSGVSDIKYENLGCLVQPGVFGQPRGESLRWWNHRG